MKIRILSYVIASFLILSSTVCVSGCSNDNSSSSSSLSSVSALSSDESIYQSADQTSNTISEISESLESSITTDVSTISDVSEIASNTLLIGTVEDFANFAKTVNNDKNTYAGKTVKLTADLDFSELDDYTPVGWQDDYTAYAFGDSNYVYDSYFSGTFDGDGHKITGLALDSVYSCNGLFGVLDGATIKNLGIESDVTVSYDDCHGSAILAGVCRNVVFDSCYVSGSIRAYSEKCNDCGGITGLGFNTIKFINCYTFADLETASLWTVGGLAGYFWTNCAVDIENCYSASYVSAVSADSNNVGSLFGSADATSTVKITNSYILDNMSRLYGSSVDEIAGILTTDNIDILNESDLQGIASTLGNAYAQGSSDFNNGFPVLAWQK